MSHASPSTPVSALARSTSSRDLRLVRLVQFVRLLGVVFILAFLLAAMVFVLPSAGLLLFVVGLALLFALPFAVVTAVADDLAPFQ
jgi:hypothetical protein